MSNDTSKFKAYLLERRSVVRASLVDYKEKRLLLDDDIRKCTNEMVSLAPANTLERTYYLNQIRERRDTIKRERSDVHGTYRWLQGREAEICQTIRHFSPEETDD